MKTMIEKIISDSFANASFIASAACTYSDYEEERGVIS